MVALRFGIIRLSVAAVDHLLEVYFYRHEAESVIFFLDFFFVEIFEKVITQ